MESKTFPLRLPIAPGARTQHIVTVEGNYANGEERLREMRQSSEGIVFVAPLSDPVSPDDREQVQRIIDSIDGWRFVKIEAMQDKSPITRDEYLSAIYNKAGGDILQDVRLDEVNADLGLDGDQANGFVMFLEQRGDIQDVPMGLGSGRLTVQGVERVENQRQSSDALLYAIVTRAERGQIESALRELDALDIEDKLDDPDSRAEYEADRATVGAQMRSPRPKRAILKPALSLLAQFAVQIGAGVVGNKLTGLI